MNFRRRMLSDPSITRLHHTEEGYPTVICSTIRSTARSYSLVWIDTSFCQFFGRTE